MTERDYVLGTHGDEIERLGFQHHVWRERAINAWTRAGIRAGAHVIDYGAGPGFAALDLADLVGPTGVVHALERSHNFITTLNDQARARGLAQIRAHELDLATDDLPVSGADAAWVRWVFAFLPQPQKSLRKLADAMKPGAALVIHEYVDYRSFQLTPKTPAFERFVEEVIANWRASGGEPDIARALPEWLMDLGFTLESLRPHVLIVRKQDVAWQWPAGFVQIHIDRLLELGRISTQLADEMRNEFERATAQPGALIVTPMVMEIVARK